MIFGLFLELVIISNITSCAALLNNRRQLQISETQGFSLRSQGEQYE